MSRAVHLALTSLGPFFEEAHFALATELASEATHALAALEDPAASLRALGESRLLGYLVPEALGGAKVGRAHLPRYVDVRSLVLVRDALGQVSPLADTLFAVQGLGTYPVVLAGTAAQRARYLPGALTGERMAAFALTEPEAGSDASALQTTARREGDGWVLDGDKTLISNAPIADYYVLFARTGAPDEAAAAGAPAKASSVPARKGISAFLVPGDAPGLTGEPLSLSVAHPLGTLHLRACRLPGDALLGEVGGGYRLAMETLEAFRIAVGAAACGMAARALACSVAHVTHRKQFGHPLAELPRVKSYLAEMATSLDAARLLVIRAAHRRDRTDERVATEAAMAKMFATEAAQRIIDLAVQLHGGAGVLQGTEVEMLYRAIRPLRIYEGTTEIQELIIARGVLAGARTEALGT